MGFFRALTSVANLFKWVLLALVGGFVGAVAAFSELGIIFRWF